MVAEKSGRYQYPTEITQRYEQRIRIGSGKFGSDKLQVLKYVDGNFEKRRIVFNGWDYYGGRDLVLINHEMNFGGVNGFPQTHLVPLYALSEDVVRLIEEQQRTTVEKLRTSIRRFFRRKSV